MLESLHDSDLSDVSHLLSFRVLVANLIRALFNDHNPLTTAYAFGEVCQFFTKGQQFTPGTPVSSTSKTDSHDNFYTHRCC